jgi:phosphatidate cytidylyltransferase
MNGLFWFFFPMATVVMNDVSAYFCGITFGRRFIKAPFLSLSPNKTWEGFIGAGILTVIFSFFFPLLLVRWKWFTCPQTNGLELSPFPEPLSCDVNPVFLPAEYHFFGDNSIEILPIQLHGMVYGLFASIVSPFGGFFASAIKRAYNKKDFDSFMPGHGGLMDRMDCQIVMISFCYVHYMTFIRTKVVSVDEVMRLVQQMTTASQQDLYIQLGKYIAIENSH